MAVYPYYVFIASAVSIMLNVFFLLVTHLRRVEGFQEVLVFMRNISIGYILMALCLLTVAPQSITSGTATIRVPYGVVDYFDSTFLNIIASAGSGCYLYTAICFCILFFYRFNVTCKTSTMSTIFSRKNILVFLIATGFFCIIQSVLIYYSAVDPVYLREKLNRTRDTRDDLQPELFGTSQLIAISTPNNVPQSAAAANVVPHNTVAADAENSQSHAHISSSSPSGGGSMTSQDTSKDKKQVFGTDYQKNPMIFLSLGIYAATVFLSFLGTVVMSMVVYTKLHKAENYGKESMSGKSKDEQIMLTKILMLVAYIPIALATIMALNFVVCVIRQKSMPFQEQVLGYAAPWLAITFPILIIILVPALRVTAFQVLICQVWKTTADGGDSDMNGNTISNSRMAVREGEDGKLSDAQLRVLSSMSNDNK